MTIWLILTLLLWAHSAGAGGAKSRLAYSAKSTFKGSLDIGYGDFSASLRGIYRSTTFHRDPQFHNAPYTIFNAFVRYDNLIETDRYRIGLFLKADNLLDKRYYNVSDGGAADIENEYSDFLVTPQDPRRIVGGVTVSFE